jgi:hypothetical protein
VVEENCMRSFITCTLAKYNYIDQVKKDKMGKACSTHWEKRTALRVVVEKTEGKGPIGRPRRRLEGNIKIDLR